MKKNLVRSAFGIFILLILTSSAFPQWVQTNWPEESSFFELYSSEGVIFARTWDLIEGGRVFYTDDNGDTWTQISSPDSDIDILSLSMKDNQILAGAWDGLYRSMIDEILWEEFTPAGISVDSPIWAISVIDDTIFASAKGVVYQTTMDNIDSWTSTSIGIPANAYLTDIVKNGDVLLAGSDSNGVFISEDDGMSWVDMDSGITDKHISDLVLADTKLFAVTLKEGVFVTDIDSITDFDSVTWQAYDPNIGHINCLFNTGDLLFAGTDVNGAYLSDDCGQNWLAVHYEIPENIRIWSMEQNNGEIFAGTNFGVWKIDPEDINNFTISVSVAEGGYAFPESDSSVYENGSRIFEFTPELGYIIGDVIVDGNSVGAVKTYTFTNVTEDHSIAVEFSEVPIYTITASSQEGGIITPSGDIQLSETWSQEFTISTLPGHAIDDVIVDGSSVGAVSSYAFNDVSSNHTITVNTKEAPFIINASAAAGGTIYPSGDVEVWRGTSEEFTISPSEGHIVMDVIVDGVSVGAIDSYTFTSVDSHHTISVVFASLTAYQINCGGDDELPFTEDAYYEGGSDYSMFWGSVEVNVVDPAPDDVYESDRNGNNFTYTFPELVSGASYKVRLHLADNSYGGWGGSSSNDDIFDVIINGVTVLSDYNIYSQAGGKNVAIIEEATAAANEAGQLIIEFSTTNYDYDARVCGIEIIMQ